MLSVGSLFSGIGGLDLGLAQAGHEIDWQCEINPYARDVLRRQWPHVKKYKDIRGVKDVRTVDVVCGGFPCNDTSRAGTKQGLEGRKSKLWYEMRRIIGDIRPLFAVVEQPANVLFTGVGIEVINGFAKIGYGVEWEVIQACQFGYPHTRERAIFVAYPDHIKRQLQLQGGIQNGRRWVYNCVEEKIHEVSCRKKDEAPQPFICRMDHGFSKRLDALGMSALPQIGEVVGLCLHDAVAIMEECAGVRCDD